MAYLTIPRDMMRRTGEDEDLSRVAFGANGLSGVPRVETPKLTVPTPAPPVTERPEDFKLPASLTVPGRVDVAEQELTRYPVGATPSQKIQIDLNARRGASPRSPVTETAEGVSVGPPKPQGHGFWNTLKNVGRGAVIGMGDIARERAQHGQDADLGALLGGAAAGGAGGGLSPLTIDKRIADEAIRRKEGKLARAIDLEAGQAQLEKLIHPELKIPEDKEVGGRILRKQPDGSYKTVYEPPQKAATERDVTLPDGRIVRKQPDGTYQEVYKAPDKPEKPEKPESPEKIAERKRKRDAAAQKMEILTSQESDAMKAKDFAAQAVKDLETDYESRNAEGRAAMKPILDRAKQEYEEAQKKYKSFAEQKNKVQQEISENTDPPSAPKLTIEGAIEAFRKKKGRAPNQTEIKNMQAAIGQ